MADNVQNKEFNAFKEWARMVKADEQGSCTIACESCPIQAQRTPDLMCSRWIKANPDIAMEIIRKWAEEHPVKTRQSMLLEDFPNVYVEQGVVYMCPKRIDKTWSYDCCGLCSDCRKKFWLEEIE